MSMATPATVTTTTRLTMAFQASSARRRSRRPSPRPGDAGLLRRLDQEVGDHALLREAPLPAGESGETALGELGRPVASHRDDLELALRISHRLGSYVLRSAGAAEDRDPPTPAL